MVVLEERTEAWSLSRAGKDCFFFGTYVLHNVISNNSHRFSDLSFVSLFLDFPVFSFPIIIAWLALSCC